MNPERYDDKVCSSCGSELAFCICVEATGLKVVQKAPDKSCDNCKSWGPTIDRDEHPKDTVLIPCPKCKRLTWPNLGVNLPAGAAVAVGSANQLPTAKRISERRFNSTGWWQHKVGK
jgi:hypothetical protein